MKIFLYLSIGLSVGTVSGALGIGGGVLLVPALIGLCHFETGRAAGTSLAVLMIPVCLPAAWKAMSQDRVDLEAACWIAAAFALGAYGGSSLVPALSEATLRLLFGLLMVGIGLRFLLAGLPGTDHFATALTATCLGGAGLFAWFAWRRLPGREATGAPAELRDSRPLEYWI